MPASATSSALLFAEGHAAERKGSRGLLEMMMDEYTKHATVTAHPSVARHIRRARLESLNEEVEDDEHCCGVHCGKGEDSQTGPDVALHSLAQSNDADDASEATIVFANKADFGDADDPYKYFCSTVPPHNSTACVICGTGAVSVAFGCGHTSCDKCSSKLHACPVKGCNRIILTRAKTWCSLKSTQPKHRTMMELLERHSMRTGNPNSPSTAKKSLVPTATTNPPEKGSGAAVADTFTQLLVLLGVAVL